MPDTKVKMNFSAFLREADKDVAEIARKYLQRVGRLVVKECSTIAAKEFSSERPEERSVRAGVHYKDSFRSGQVRQKGNKVAITAGSSHPAAYLLEYGAGQHRIAPGGRRNKGPTRSPMVVGSERLAWPANNISGDPFVVMPKGRSVLNPGFEGKRVLQRGLRAAAQKQRRTVRK